MLTEVIIGDFITNVLSGLAVEGIKGAGLWFLAKWKNRNQQKILEVAQEDLNKRGYKQKEELHRPSEKFLINFIPQASAEDEPSLQELWGHLLAHALDPNFDKSKLRVAYMDIIKSLDVTDTVVLHHCLNRGPYETYKSDDVFDFTSLSIGEYELSIENLKRLQLVTVPLRYGDAALSGDSFIPANNQIFQLTSFGRAFLEACAS